MMNVTIRRVILGLMLGMLLAGNLTASETYWLSDIAPTRELAKEMRPSHGGMVIRSRQGYTKKLWLRKGRDIAGSTYVKKNDTTLFLVGPEESVAELAFSNKSYADIAFKMPNEGFYNLFMTDKQIEGGVLEESVVKSEALNHSCRSGHDHTREKMPPLYYEGASFDIVRERLPRETFHSRMTSGDIISYKVLLHGQPVNGAAVTMVTQKGWSKTQETDPEGMVHFEMIRDYYPPWHEFNTRNMENFLIIAEHERADNGSYQGKEYDSIHYKATVAGNYYPSTRDYKSYSYGLLIGLFGLTVSVFLIYLYRRKRTDVYKEKSLG